MQLRPTDGFILVEQAETPRPDKVDNSRLIMADLGLHPVYQIIAVGPDVKLVAGDKIVINDMAHKVSVDGKQFIISKNEIVAIYV